MSDISLHFSPLEWAAMAAILGWPGLLLGGLVGALAWRTRRIVGGALGAVFGAIVIAALRVFAF